MCYINTQVRWFKTKQKVMIDDTHKVNKWWYLSNKWWYLSNKWWYLSDSNMADLKPYNSDITNTIRLHHWFLTTFEGLKAVHHSFSVITKLRMMLSHTNSSVYMFMDDRTVCPVTIIITSTPSLLLQLDWMKQLFSSYYLLHTVVVYQVTEFR